MLRSAGADDPVRDHSEDEVASHLLVRAALGFGKRLAGRLYVEAIFVHRRTPADTDGV